MFCKMAIERHANIRRKHHANSPGFRSIMHDLLVSIETDLQNCAILTYNLRESMVCCLSWREV